jgi:hypothetical protein
MFYVLLFLSIIVGIVISWIGWFGQADHDKGRGRNDR